MMHIHWRTTFRFFFYVEFRDWFESAFRKLVLNCWRILAGAVFLVLASPALANDDMLIYSGYTNVIYGTMNYNNGWQNWGWVPNYVTNNPNYNGTNSIVFAANSSYQALHLNHDPIDTTLYTTLTLRLNGGAQGWAVGRYRLNRVPPGGRRSRSRPRRTPGSSLHFHWLPWELPM